MYYPSIYELSFEFEVYIKSFFFDNMKGIIVGDMYDMLVPMTTLFILYLVFFCDGFTIATIFVLIFVLILSFIMTSIYF